MEEFMSTAYAVMIVQNREIFFCFPNFRNEKHAKWYELYIIPIDLIGFLSK